MMPPSSCLGLGGLGAGRGAVNTPSSPSGIWKSALPYLLNRFILLEVRGVLVGDKWIVEEDAIDGDGRGERVSSSSSVRSGRVGVCLLDFEEKIEREDTVGLGGDTVLGVRERKTGWRLSDENTENIEDGFNNQYMIDRGKKRTRGHWVCVRKFYAIYVRIRVDARERGGQKQRRSSVSADRRKRRWKSERRTYPAHLPLL